MVTKANCPNISNEIPVLNLNDFYTDRERFVKQLKSACCEIGFFSITGHRISPSLTMEMRTQLQIFFSLPNAEKEKLTIIRDNYRGYIPLGFFTPNGSDMPADQYEAYKLHTEISPKHPICQACDLYGENRWPLHPSGLTARIAELSLENSGTYQHQDGTLLPW